MRQGGAKGGVRLWAARLLMVCAIAVCAGAVRAPVHSPDPIPSVAGLAMSPGGYGTGAQARSAPVVGDTAGAGQRRSAADMLVASADVPGPDCGCCAHDAATCCVAITEEPSLHGCLCLRDPAGHEVQAPGSAGFHSHVGRAAPPSLSELSLLRI